LKEKELKKLLSYYLSEKNHSYEINLEKFENSNFELIDMRDNKKSTKLPVKIQNCLINFPHNYLSAAILNLNHNKKYLFICEKGKKSKDYVTKLRSKGLKNTFALAGGIENYFSTKSYIS
jgi:rhodanese-related sulfurtransferase